jgi:plastocyanin
LEVKVMRPVLALIGITGLLLVGMLAAPATLAGGPCHDTDNLPPRTEAAAVEIKVAPCSFGPTVAHVPVGATVTFFNGPGESHLITGANSEWGSRDVELQPAQKIAYTFDKAGIYPYACALHRGMTGTIVVGDTSARTDAAAPAAVTGAAPPSDGQGAGTGSQGFGIGQVLAAGAGGLVLGGLAAVGLLRARRRGDQALADAAARS